MAVIIIFISFDGYGIILGHFLMWAALFFYWGWLCCIGLFFLGEDSLSCDLSR